MPNIIERFCIRGLFGKKDIELEFKNKAQIYVGENGLGKTTVLNALNSLLSCEFESLLNINFSRIDIKLRGILYSFSKEEFKAYTKAKNSRTRRSGFYQSLNRTLTDVDIKKLQTIIRSGRNDMSRLQEIMMYLKSKGYNFSAPDDFLMEMITQVVVDRAEISQIDMFKKSMENLGVRILYFPTYRRIEKDVRTMLRERRSNVNRNYSYRDSEWETGFVEELSETVHSGMSDIKTQRDKVLRTISDISRKELDTLSIDLLKKQIAGISESIKLKDEDVEKIEAIIHKSQVGLTPEEQEEVMRKVKSKDILKDEHKFLLYLLTRLIDIYNSYAAYDLGIKSFVQVCNSYLHDKHFTYNEADLNLDLEFTESEGPVQEVLDLAILSSGEKQLVALFATIYLYPDRHFVMLIDEPELSLSIYWQRKLLPDVMKSPNCDFLFAVTHSPFIFENELQAYTTGMNEYAKSL